MPSELSDSPVPEMVKSLQSNKQHPLSMHNIEEGKIEPKQKSADRTQEVSAFSIKNDAPVVEYS
jgi:hypothetical protein